MYTQFTDNKYWLPVIELMEHQIIRLKVNTLANFFTSYTIVQTSKRPAVKFNLRRKKSDTVEVLNYHYQHGFKKKFSYNPPIHHCSTIIMLFWFTFFLLCKWSEDGCCCEKLGCTVGDTTYELDEQMPYGDGNPYLTCACQVGSTRESCLWQVRLDA